MNKSLIPLILIILGVGLYFTVTKDVFDQAKLVKSSNDEYEKAIDSAKNLISLRDKVLVNYNNISVEDRARLNKIVPTGVDNIRLIIDLNNVALKHNFVLRGIKASAGSTKTNQSVYEDGSTIDRSVPTLENVQVSFSLNAPYQQFISFMQDLEASLRILDVTSLSVTAADNGIYTWNVNLKTYWLKRP